MPPRPLALFLLALVSLAAPAAAAPLRDDSPADYAMLAARFRADHGLGSGDAGIEEVFIPARLAGVVLELPRASLAADPAPLRRAALAVLDMQARWLDWMGPVVGTHKEEKKDFATVRKWIADWRPRQQLGAEPDLFVAAGAPDAVRAAADRLARAVEDGLLSGTVPEDTAPAQLALMPTRRDFVGFLAFLGTTDENFRGYFWVPSMTRWTMGFAGDIQVVAMQYFDPGNPSGATEEGISMDARSKTGLEQQVAQLAANGLFERLFGQRVPEAFSQGLAMDLVIDVWGELATRIDGDLRERFTAPQERFIPGAPSAGGALPPLSAESRWRERQGSDRFVTALQRSLEAGTEELRRKGQMAFSLIDDKGAPSHLVRTPILGAGGTQDPPPEECQGDWLEFLRAYKAGFVYWLRTEAARKKSGERFATLLARLCDPAEEADFETLFVELYEGTPLSAEEPGDKTLEGRFLTWLSKRR